MIAEGLSLSERAAATGPAGPYTIQARIAACHAKARSAGETDWARIVRLYEWLSLAAPSPVVDLNRAAAVAMRDGPESGLELIEAIEGLDGYGPLHAARADLLRRIGGRDAEAAASYRRASELSANQAERRFLERRLGELSAGSR
jgi:RNA polymerase sigma-70 factor, ECF subfamily